ncbi:MAG TPA: sodium:proton antiporter [Bacilli bacterium]
MILSIGMISGKISILFKIPDVVLFIVAGIIIGQGLQLINEESASLYNQFILVVGAALILFDGGRNIRLSGLKKVWLTVTLLSIPGVMVTIAVIGFAAHYLLGIPYLYAFLLGSIIASTDPASIIPVFKQVKIRPKVRETVESESAFNDATASIMTFTILAIILKEQKFSITSSLFDFFKTAGGGILVGCCLGYLISISVAHLKLGFLRDYTTIAMIVTALSTYLIGDFLDVSGLMATFTAGLIWGNSARFGLHMHDKLNEMGHFSENITVIMRMLIFILLGSQVDFLIIYEYLWQSLGLILLLMFVARPLTVFLSTWPDWKAQWTWKELLFMCWVRETGVIPAALAGVILGMGVKHADIISSVTFMAILLTILIQASTTAYVGRKLGIVENIPSSTKQE